MAQVTVSLPMSVKVKESELQVEAETVFEAVAAVVAVYPELEQRFFPAPDQLAGSLIVFVNDEQMERGAAKSTVLKDRDRIDLMFALAGGESTPAFSRYARQVTLEEVGVQGQRKLLQSRVLIVGAGGLGVPAATYLAAAGIGRIGLVDHDVIDVTNLARQVLYAETDIGRPKVTVAVEQLQRINPHVTYDAHLTMLTTENAFEIIREYDLVMNCTDNFEARYLINELCVSLAIPFVDAAAVEFIGHLAVFLPGKGCYNCLFPETDPQSELTCGGVGVFSPVVGYFGTLAAIETMKVLLGLAKPHVLHTYNALSGQHRNLKWKTNAECPVCSRRHGEDVLQNVLLAELAADPLSMSANEFSQRLGGEKLVVVDLRDDLGREESPFAVPPHVTYLPIPFSLFEYDFPFDAYGGDAGQIIVCFCEKGVRSRFAAYQLRERGVERAYHLKGGLRALAAPGAVAVAE
ncbi:MAG: ThiF family adenylyltransferase [Tumebacillaceae bacterium]